MFLNGWILLVLTSLSLPAATAANVVCESGFESFKKNVHPTLQKKCLDCHDSGADGPPHSQNDALAAFEVALESVEFPDFKNSLFIQRIKEKHWLLYDSSQTGMEVSEATSLLKKWYEEGQKQCRSHYKNVSQEITLPTSLPSLVDNRFSKIEIPLKEIAQEWKNSFFEFDVQLFSEASANKPASYRIMRPRIRSDIPLEVKGVFFVVNGFVNRLENTFLAVHQKVNPSTPSATLSEKSLIMLKKFASTKIAVGFESIHRIPSAVSCREEDAFKQGLFQEMKSLKCLDCHGDSRKSAYARFPLSSAADACTQTLLRSSLQSSRGSRSLFLAFARGSQGHPALDFYDYGELKSAFLKWLKAERP